MSETIIYQDADLWDGKLGYRVIDKKSQTVTVYPGRLKVGNEHYSLVGVLKSAVQTSLHPLSNENRPFRIGAWTAIAIAFVLKFLFLYFRGRYAPALTMNEIFDGWWYIVFLYVFAFVCKYVDQTQQYHKTDLVLTRTDKETRITIASYYPEVVRSEEWSMWWHRDSNEEINERRKVWRAAYNANLHRIEQIAEAVGRAIK